MKKHSLTRIIILTCCLFICTQNLSAQEFNIDSIPKNGIVLDQGWKFHEGDNAQWAKPEFDDRDWEAVNPTSELHHLPRLREKGIGWFRLKLLVDSSLRDKAVAVVLSSVGASEIYLNGELIYRLGTVSSDFRREQTRLVFALPSGLKFADQPTQLLSVRYSFNKKNLYLKFINIPPVMQIVLKDINQTFTDNTKGEGFLSLLRSIQLSFYLPLGVLILFLYYSFPNRNEYFYFGVYCFCMFAGILFHILGLLPDLTSSQGMLFSLAEVTVDILGFLSLINGIHVLYKINKGWFFQFIVMYAVLIVPFFFISNNWGGLFLLVFVIIIVFEFVHLNFQAVRRHIPLAWILFITSALLIPASLCMVWLFLSGNIYLYWVLFSIAYAIPAIGLSLFTAGDFAQTGLSLQLRVAEVEELFAKTISQEKEKQQILTSQNETLETQVSERTLDLKLSIEELKSTQAQLIQSEKMASLGELTSGIAHEIQNPLNFVNNFSEVSTEMIDEMAKEFADGRKEEGAALISDIKQNLEKILYHGKRADAIVKGMLQHSRSSTGKREPTDINSLADEYFRLAYHGLRAKNSTFNATMETDFDRSIQNVRIVAQDVGRVLLNLINNAFYAVTEKCKLNDKTYQPKVSVSTKRLGNIIEIHVRDNGNGIPQKIREKIFQPFFTTKPTGEGTGLGLSISYDIIRAHGGEITVETQEGEYAEFIITLPV